METGFKQRIYVALLATAGVLTAVVLWVLAVFSSAAADKAIAEALVAMLSIVIGEAAQAAGNWIVWMVPAGTVFFGYGLLSLFLGGAIAADGRFRKKAWMFGSVIAVLLICVDVVLRVINGREGWMTVPFWAVLGVAAAWGVVCLWNGMWQRFPRLLNRETVSYIVFGVLTTVVNMVAYDQFFHRLQLANLVSNALAWVAAVLFAYVVNKWFVFRSRNATWRQWLREFSSFIGARLLSLGADELGMFLLVDCLRADANLSKLAANVVVMILNYFFSKWFIFRQKEGSADESSCS